MSKFRDKLDKAGIPDATRHLFLCLGPDCCRMRDGEPFWQRAWRERFDRDLL